MRKSDWSAVMAAARAKFKRGNEYGVVAFGVGKRITAGRSTAEHALSAYVVRKSPDPIARLRTLRVSRGLVVPIDVVGLGRPPAAQDVTTAKPHFVGLYCGAAIRARGPIPELGGIACVLRNASGPTHVITAGHLFPRGVPGVSVQGGARGEPPRVIGQLAINLLDKPFAGMPFPIDVALVRLNADGARIVRQSTDGPFIVNTLGTDYSFDVSVKAFLPTAFDYSRTTTTLGHAIDAQMKSAVRGAYFVRGAIATTSLITNPGDSGTLLFNGEPSSASAAGVCVGQLGTMSVFEPLERALDVLRQFSGISLGTI